MRSLLGVVEGSEEDCSEEAEHDVLKQAAGRRRDRRVDLARNRRSMVKGVVCCCFKVVMGVLLVCKWLHKFIKVVAVRRVVVLGIFTFFN